MALYIPHSIFHLARLLYVRPETFGPTLVACQVTQECQMQLLVTQFKIISCKFYAVVVYCITSNCI
jgi:hypothetical protein